MSVKHWQSNGAYGRINQMKQIFVEPRTKAEFTEAMEGFYERIRDPNTKGAAFFAVCRGKVSEGLDFADTNGRAVVITGMPYPPRHDARVILKMNFLDEMKNKRTFKGLTGKDWYQQQASRAVNQAVGRVLRHKGDYGAIILCDERFVYANNLAELPLWVRPYIKKYNNFGEIQRHLTQFFRRAVQLCDKSCIKQNFQPIETPSNTTELSVPSVPVKHLKKALSAFEKIPMSTERDLTSRDISKETPLTVHNYSNTVTSCTDSRLAKPKGCLEYLDAYENEKKCNSEQELGSCSNCSTSPVEETTHARTAVKKKLKIVRSKHQHEEKESERFDKVANARRYIQKIKTTLGKEKLVVFSNTLKEYKQNNDINSLLRSLTPLLLNEKKNYEMFLGFSSYIESTEQREIFFKKYTDITGEEIPGEFEKRKRQTKPDTTTSSKKARIECL